MIRAAAVLFIASIIGAAAAKVTSTIVPADHSGFYQQKLFQHKRVEADGAQAGAPHKELFSGPLSSGQRISSIVRLSPRDFGSLDAVAAASVCKTLELEVGKGDMSLKTAMKEEGGIDGLIAILETHGVSDLAVADNCLGAMAATIYYQEALQHYAGQLGLEEIAVQVLRAHMDNQPFMAMHIADTGSFTDFCNECGDSLYQAGADQLMYDSMKKWIDDVNIVQNVLNGLTGCLFHTTDGATRVKQYELGLLDLMKDVMKRYPFEPKDTWLKVRQEVMIVTAAMSKSSSREREVRDAIVRKGYFEEVFKLMEEERLDPPSQSKCSEFINYLSEANATYAEHFVQMGAIEHLVWSLGNYTTPTGKFADQAGMFWNVDYAASSALNTLLIKVPSSRVEMVNAGAVPLLIKAARNPEGAYQDKSYGALYPACEVLKRLSVESSEAATAVSAECDKE